MYNEFFGFSEKPFEATPDPKFLYLTSSHRDALIALFDGVTNQKGFISLTGEAGTGRKTLVHFMLGRLEEKVKAAFISHSSPSFKDLLRDLFLELGMEAEEETKRFF